ADFLEQVSRQVQTRSAQLRKRGSTAVRRDLRGVASHAGGARDRIDRGAGRNDAEPTRGAVMPTLDPYSIFVPTKELDQDTAYLFAGRQETLLAAAKSLSKPEGCVAFYGDRGVGKSSLGRILMGLLDGRIPPEEVGLRSDSAFTRRAC